MQEIWNKSREYWKHSAGGTGVEPLTRIFFPWVPAEYFQRFLLYLSYSWPSKTQEKIISLHCQLQEIHFGMVKLLFMVLYVWAHVCVCVRLCACLCTLFLTAYLCACVSCISSYGLPSQYRHQCRTSTHGKCPCRPSSLCFTKTRFIKIEAEKIVHKFERVNTIWKAQEKNCGSLQNLSKTFSSGHILEASTRWMTFLGLNVFMLQFAF